MVLVENNNLPDELLWETKDLEDENEVQPGFLEADYEHDVSIADDQPDVGITNDEPDIDITNDEPDFMKVE